MTVHGRSLTKYLRISLAGFMSVWLSGVVLLFCCEEMNGRSADADPMAAMAGHCDKMHQVAADSSTDPGTSAVQEIQTDRADCCGLLPAVFDKVRKIEKDRQHVAPSPAVAVVKYLPPAVITCGSAHPAASFARAVYPEKIFVKNCVFRI